VKRLFFVLRYVVFLVLGKAMQEDQALALTIGNDGAVSAAFAATEGPDALLDEKAAKAGIDKTALDFTGSLAQAMVR
jgi:hypothetical protein